MPSIFTRRMESKKDRVQEKVEDKVGGKNYAASLSDDIKEEIVELVIENYEDDLRSRSDLEERWDDSFKRWYGKTGERRGPWEDSADLRVPITGIAIETYHPRVMDAIWGIVPVVQVRARNRKSAKNLDLVQEFMNWEVSEEMEDLQDICDDTFHSCLIYGTAVQKAYWMRDWEEVDEDQEVYQTDDNGFPVLDEQNEPIQLLDKDGKPKTKKVRVRYKEERPQVDLIDIDDFICPLMGSNLQKSDHVMQRLYLTEDYLRRLGESNRFVDVDNVIDAGPSHYNFKKKSRLKETKNRVIGLNDAFKIKSNDRYVVLEYYGRYDIDKDGLEEECVFWVDLESRTLLRAKLLRDVFKHGKRPFIAYKFIRVENQFYGIGIPQFMESIQDEVDAIHNQRVDAGTIANIPFGFYRPAAGFDPDDVEFGPGVWIPVDDVNDVKFGQFPDVRASAFNEENLLIGYYEKLMGVNDYSAGRNDDAIGTRATARGTQALIGEANVRFDLIIKRFQVSFKELLKQIMKLNQQYMPDGKEIRVMGPRGRDLFKRRDRTSIAGDFDFTLYGNSRNTNPGLKAQAAENLYGTLMANPIIAQNPQAIYYLTKLYVDSYKDRIPGLDINTLLPEGDGTQQTNPDQNQENMQVISGDVDRLMAQPTDDHQTHLLKIRILKGNKIWKHMSTRQRAIIEDHERQHIDFLRSIRESQKSQGMFAGGKPALPTEERTGEIPSIAA